MSDTLYRLLDELKECDRDNTTWADRMEFMVDPFDAKLRESLYLVKEIMVRDMKNLREGFEKIQISINRVFGKVLQDHPYGTKHPHNFRSLNIDVEDVSDKLSNLSKEINELGAVERLSVIRSLMDSALKEMDMIVRDSDTEAKSYDYAFTELDPQLKALAWEMREFMELIEAGKRQLDILAAESGDIGPE